MRKQGLSAWDIYRQSWRLYWQTHSRYRQLRQLDCEQTTPQHRWFDVWCDIKSFYQSPHQCGTSLELMSMQVMLLRYEGQTQPLEAVQRKIEESQKQREILSNFERWPFRGFYRGLLSLLLLLVSLILLPRLKPGLSSMLGGFGRLEMMGSLAVIICLIGCAE